MKNHIKVSAITLASITSPFWSTSINATDLKVNCFWPAQHLVCQEVLPNWLKQVEEASKGRVSGKVLATSAASPEEQVQAVEAGIVDVAVQFNGFIPEHTTGALVAMTPFVASNDARAMSAALWQTNRTFFPDELNQIHLLSQWVISPAELYSQTDTPINSMAELTSRTLWSLPGVLENLMNKIGAQVIAIPPVKSSEVISTGVVNAHIGLDPSDVSAFKLFPYTKSMTRFTNNVYASGFSLVMNKDVWQSLPPEDKKAIMSVSGEHFSQLASGYWQEASEAALKEFSNEGGKIVTAKPDFEAQLKQASKYMTEDWIEKANCKGIDGQGAYDFYTKKVAELSQ
ncbi:TRAP-type C4-dicarboxylate transport system, periplasmic component [Marinomonas sp. MED121]|uniref:TRAP transporter substrate-binding protein n=1 Tax=Marinomonas sp. MED121 TaxID=314277 RepID=UPI000068FA98|nr:TRAP transporter substrate-binding protein [Marinomonas sp. MED121]EAQ63937.1 TRAP-type C4-dicarboxylate transport system, periplasmic component [Marinomonas sp. MED121]